MLTPNTWRSIVILNCNSIDMTIYEQTIQHYITLVCFIVKPESLSYTWYIGYIIIINIYT